MEKEIEFLKIKKLSDKAIVPKRCSDFAAGYDLHTAYDCIIPPNNKFMIKTDLQIEFPSGTYGRIAPRSSVAWNHFLSVGAGVIDSDFRGNICIILFNHSNEHVTFKAGDRVAQLICEKIKCPIIKEVDILTQTKRNDMGFGSTGK
jgi:dUTP pyrophosphatase